MQTTIATVTAGAASLRPCNSPAAAAVCPHHGALRLANAARVMLAIACLVWLASCASINLQPFAEASKTLSVSVNTGGDLAIKPLARMPLWSQGTVVSPGDPNHPAPALAVSWDHRRTMMDAVLVYSASLGAINEASAQRKAHAAGLVGSVQQLASAVPSLSVGASAAGDLVVFGLGTTIEIKAWHSMRQAVQAADAAIQLVAQALQKDFVELSNAFESHQLDQRIQRSNASRPVERVHKALQEQRSTQRTRVAAAPADATAGAELARLEGLIAAVEVDIHKRQAEQGKIEKALADGKEFFAAAGKAVAAWARAHADLVQAFEQERTPNLTLLAARAEELQEIVRQLKQ